MMTLTVGQLVRLYCEKARHPTLKEIIVEYAGRVGELYTFRLHNVTLGLTPCDDGTLRDGEGRIVEVREV